MLDLAEVGLSILVTMARVSGVFVATPIFSSPNLPAVFKIGLILSISFILYPFLGGVSFVMELSLLGFVGLLAKELLVGIVLGVLVNLFFSIFQIAGELIDMPIGFGVVNFLDPNMGGQVPLMGRVHYILVVLTVLAINGHHLMIRALAHSYELVPLGHFAISQKGVEQYLYWFSETFLVAVSLAMPVIAAIFLVDIGLGLLNRAVPQINVFIVGFPVKIGVGLAVVALGLPFYLQIVKRLFSSNGSLIEALIGILKTIG
ncbi:MAG: flagellar biosynthetic protein FliR [Bacillota bacterium]|nr:flagellar biosynthetic protein FliR [Bacillota bacterium]